jgi:hypothetical protein
MAQAATPTEANKNDRRDLFRKQFQKTELCSFFEQGRCKYGENCSFAHGGVETPPDLTKTSLCKRWKEGRCPFSSANCRFAHGKHNLRVTALYVQNRQGSSKNEKKAEEAATMATSHGLVKPAGPQRSPNCPESFEVPMPSIFCGGIPEKEVTVQARTPGLVTGSSTWQASDNAIDISAHLSSAALATSPEHQEPPMTTSPWMPRPLSSDAFNPMKVCTERADIDNLMPMKITPTSLFANGRFSSAPSPKLPHFTSAWDLWDGDDTAVGETSSEDDGSLSYGSHSSMALQARALDHLPEGLPGYSAFSGLPNIRW